MRRLSRSNESGAVAVVTAIFLTFMVFAAGLITIDVGQVYVERRQLQNGADAAALATAASCAKTPATCTVADLTTIAEGYASGNDAKDSLEGILEVCGTALSPSTACTTTGPALTNCTTPPAGSPLASAEYVQVRTKTATPTGSVIEALFGKDDASKDKTIVACSRASLGGVVAASGTAWTASACEWNKATKTGTEFPAYVEMSLSGKSCTNSNGWGDAPGGFGWLNDPSGSCTSTVNTDGTYQGDTGNNFPKACEDPNGEGTSFRQLIDSGVTIYMPIFSGTEGSGANTTYHFLGWGAFILTGYDLNGGKYGAKCKTVSKPCLNGYFTQGLITTATEVGGTNYGAIGVGLSG